MTSLGRCPLAHRRPVLAFDRARAICREAAESSKAKLAPGIASAKTVAAVASLARVDRRLAATAEQWDSDPWLLADVTQDGDDEGALFLDRLPTPEEAVLLRHYLGMAKRAWRA